MKTIDELEQEILGCIVDSKKEMPKSTQKKNAW